MTDRALEILRHSKFQYAFQDVQTEVHETAVDKGWWQEQRGVGEVIALIHSELSEALEADRNGNPADKHCPQYTSLEVELADAIIRIMDYAQFRGLDVAGAVIAKSEFNKTRPFKHGKKF